ncbi:BMP and activin membrane-bound inhibitor homolog [Centruroides vittatus]|uniref:BMP and activin membrane-bound inhibitor homolog n=1 Tax=Centruroides vittatus TaxID=120091 RepID=UPI00350F354C
MCPQLTKYFKIFGLFMCCWMAVEGDIRCYCNLPLCVVTGYMCKSTLNACYTEHFSYSSDLSRSRHGCLDQLRHEKRTQCAKRGVDAAAATTSNPSILCCTEDMCNYVSSMDINIQVHTRSNSSRVAGIYDYNNIAKTRRELALQQDVWFRAAVIAVPIAGSFILILLVLVAVRMLRRDSKRHRQFLELRRQRRMLLLNDQRRNKAVGMYLTAPTWDKDYVYEKPLNSSFLLWTKWTPNKQADFV